VAKINLLPSKCAYVVQASPNKNYENKSAVFTGRYKSLNDLYRSLFKFDLSKINNINEAKIIIKSAVLRLYLMRNEVQSVPGSSTLYIYRLTEEFDEKTVTWNTQPSVSKDAESIGAVLAQKKGEVNIDLTDIVQKWVNGEEENYGVLIKGEELINSLVAFPSASYGNENLRPQLFIEYKSDLNENEAKSFNEFYTIKSEHYDEYCDSDFTEETVKLAEMIKGQKYKGIVVFPSVFEQSERHLKMLTELAQKGFLCFYCRSKTDEFDIEKVSENLFVLSGDDFLIPYIKNKFIIVICSKLIQLAWADFIPNKVVWYDISESINANPSHDKNMIIKYLNLIDKADIVSYSQPDFKEYVCKRVDSIFIPDDLSNDFEEIISSKSLYPYANVNNEGTVAVMCSTFFNRNGTDFYNGGAERYLCDLYDVFTKLGLRMHIYQQGDGQWVRRFNDIDVHSLDNKMPRKAFYENTQLTTILNVYSAFFEGHPKTSRPCIGISHGVAWDSQSYVFNSGEQFWNRNKRLIDSVHMLDAFVSVDTNTANWFQTIDYNVAMKMKVIPNYVDTNIFVPRNDFDNTNKKTVILYPRRLYKARGYYLMLDIVDDILKKYPNVEIHFVGRGVEADTVNVEEKIKKWGKRVKWYALDLNDMPLAYKQADISVIPTLNSEGTSLSCLEAMACGNAIIATRVGGLTDLVINEHNGIIINPSAQELKNAIEDLLDNPSKMIMLKKNAVMVSKAFSKSIWERKWVEVIKPMIDVNAIKNESHKKLIQIKLSNMASLDNLDIRNMIKDYLLDGCLVYVMIKNQPEYMPQSFGRLQFLRQDEEIYAQPDDIITD